MSRSLGAPFVTAFLVGLTTVACGPAPSVVAPVATTPAMRAPRELVFRETRVGKIVKPRRTTWTLTLSDATATLDVVEETAPTSSPNAAAYAWQKEGSARYDGAVDHTADRWTLKLARFCPSDDGCTPQLPLDCAEETVHVRSADAGFVDGDACEGDGPPPRETNTATHPIVILRCRTPSSEHTLDFGASPGIESYDQNDDCAGQFHTLRRIAE